MEELLPIIHNDGCFKIHRNKGSYILKLMKKKTLHYLEKSEDLRYLEDVRMGLYAHYGEDVIGEELDKDEVKKMCGDISYGIRTGVYPVTSSRNEEDDDDYDVQQKEYDTYPRIVIKKEKRDVPVSGDFIIIMGAKNTRHLAIVTEFDGYKFAVYIEDGENITLDDLETDWYFAKATVEAE